MVGGSKMVIRVGGLSVLRKGYDLYGYCFCTFH